VRYNTFVILAIIILPHLKAQLELCSNAQIILNTDTSDLGLVRFIFDLVRDSAHCIESFSTPTSAPLIACIKCFNLLLAHY
jgi:hypothetical protein